jgi:Xaa-Pro aminopeptidase
MITGLETELKTELVRAGLAKTGADACLVSTNVNLYYCTGRIFTGYLYIPVEGTPVAMVKAGNMEGTAVVPLRKPEQVPEIISAAGYPQPKNILLELGETSWLETERLKTALKPAVCGDATAFFRKLRSRKTPAEIAMFRIASERHTAAYREIPDIFRHGMTDLDFQYAMEYVMRKHGSLGIFRVYGNNMEIFAGSILAGINAEAVSPYDFALGGAGAHPSLPIGANGTKLVAGMSLMVDMGGCFTPCISDITRTFSIGRLSDAAYAAHALSIEMHDCFRREVKPGIRCADIYERCRTTADRYGLGEWFMGTPHHQAKFVGHGTGLQINELPILSPRSEDVVEENMVIAFEPKFVVPGTGAVGVENTYLVHRNGVENLSTLNEDIIML